jgi:hypothetical protein
VFSVAAQHAAQFSMGKFLAYQLQVGLATVGVRDALDQPALVRLKHFQGF